MRMSQVEMEQSSRKEVRWVQARRKVSWVRVWAMSRSRVEGEEEAEDALLVEGDDGGQIVEGSCGGWSSRCRGEDIRDGCLGGHGLDCDRVSVVRFHLL